MAGISQRLSQQHGRWLRLGLGSAVLGIGVLLGIADANAEDAKAAADAVRGATIYKLCAGCHGFNGEGNQLVKAPRIAGQEPWYLERQLRNFRDDIRGGAGDDAQGLSMAAMSKGLTSQAQIDDVAAHIATLSGTGNILPAAVAVAGDAERGRALYATCVACHGADGAGNPALQAPNLVRLDDWYQVMQLKKFKAGLRGAHPADTYGQQMAPMAGMLADDAAIADVSAYVRTLNQ